MVHSQADDQPTVTFHRVHADAIPPMRADKSALGVMPTMAFQHCEPSRTASSFGWYIFPPEDIALQWNGSDTFIRLDDGWTPLSQYHSADFVNDWNRNCPPELRDLVPAFVSRLPAPGLVQIWSGLLCSTKEDWSLLVRPLVNVRPSHLYQCFEGVVESDRFGPFPLFMNIQLIATHVAIELPKQAPLFQVQPLMRATYGQAAHQYADLVGFESQSSSMTPEDWAGYRNTIRVQAPDAPPESGRYTGAARKRSRHER